MRYLSASETAQKWGITKTRVIVLAKEGRIPGVKRVGNNWMIPEAAEKPSDKRFKKSTPLGLEDEHRFPLFLFGPFPNDELISSLTSDEKKLLEAQLALCRCEFDYCIEILSEMVDSIANLYTKIGALYILCISSSSANNKDCFRESLSKLEYLFATDFPYKKEYSFLFYDIHSLYLGNDTFMNEFSLDSEYDYNPVFLPYLTLQTTFREMLLAVKEHRTSPPYHLEILCNAYEQEHYYYTAQRLHTYIGLLCLGTEQIERAHFHFKRMIELGIKYEGYNVISTFYIYYQKYFDPVLEEYGPEIKSKIQYLSQRMGDNIRDFCGSDAVYINKTLSLTQEEHQLMFFALKNYSNKEIAEVTGIPEYTIRRKYEKLFNKYDITNKKKLGEFYITLLTAGYK